MGNATTQTEFHPQASLHKNSPLTINELHHLSHTRTCNNPTVEFLSVTSHSCTGLENTNTSNREKSETNMHVCMTGTTVRCGYPHDLHDERLRREVAVFIWVDSSDFGMELLQICRVIESMRGRQWNNNGWQQFMTDQAESGRVELHVRATCARFVNVADTWWHSTDWHLCV